VKGEFKHKLPDGFQSYVLNLRLPKFRTAACAMALELAMDYEWMNRQMFYGAYQRVKGVFGNTDCEANGLPSPRNWPCWSPCAQACRRGFRPHGVPPRTDGPSLRDNLRRRAALLPRPAGNPRRRAAQCQGRALVLEYLDSNEGGGAHHRRPGCAPWKSWA
jgi:microcin C transport system substrate-binding protein